PDFSFGRTPATPEDGRVSAIGPIPLRSIGPMAGIVGVLNFYRQEVALAVGVTAVLYWVIDRLIGCRVSEDIENQGLDLAEHGEDGYTR
ncbi:MAG: ammonium transporter, partial [Pedosphaera sp.]|nr:ammonium transporter [Pedosphaera sp.]